MSAVVSRPTAVSWWRAWLRGEPHQVVAAKPGEPYLRRWYLVPRNRWLNLYLHQFIASDPEGLHDHPWGFASVVLSGAYFEVTPSGVHRRGRASIAIRPATHRHRICLPRNSSGAEIPCWTVIVTGPHRRLWGFWCHDSRGTGERFIPWQQFADGGCGEFSGATESLEQTSAAQQEARRR